MSSVETTVKTHDDIQRITAEALGCYARIDLSIPAQREVANGIRIRHDFPIIPGAVLDRGQPVNVKSLNTFMDTVAPRGLPEGEEKKWTSSVRSYYARLLSKRYSAFGDFIIDEDTAPALPDIFRQACVTLDVYNRTNFSDSIINMDGLDEFIKDVIVGSCGEEALATEAGSEKMLLDLIKHARDMHRYKEMTQ